MPNPPYGLHPFDTGLDDLYNKVREALCSHERDTTRRTVLAVVPEMDDERVVLFVDGGTTMDNPSASDVISWVANALRKRGVSIVAVDEALLTAMQTPPVTAASPVAAEPEGGFRPGGCGLGRNWDPRPDPCGAVVPPSMGDAATVMFGDGAEAARRSFSNRSDCGTVWCLGHAAFRRGDVRCIINRPTSRGSTAECRRQL
jgi:hypothetical protein